MHAEKRWLAHSIMHGYGGKTTEDIAVKLVKRKA
jgi:hypothetical protein